jgi:uncharacterized protein DUF4157
VARSRRRFPAATGPARDRDEGRGSRSSEAPGGRAAALWPPRYGIELADSPRAPKERPGDRAAPGLLHARSVSSVLSSGAPLDGTVLASMEASFHASFSGVRVHTGAEAASVALDEIARAFTVGEDIVFAEGNYAPHTAAGRQLLAHELAHVVQQRRGGEPAGGANERDADRAAALVAAGESARVHTGAAPGIQRQEMTEEEIRAELAANEAKLAESTPSVEELARLNARQNVLAARLRELTRGTSPVAPSKPSASIWQDVHPSALPAAPKGKVVATTPEGATTLSGWAEGAEVPGRGIPALEVYTYSKETGLTLVPHFRDARGAPGSYGASHAERGALLLNPESPSVTVSKVPCFGCDRWLADFVQERGTPLRVHEPNGSWVYTPNGARWATVPPTRFPIVPSPPATPAPGVPSPGGPLTIVLPEAPAPSAPFTLAPKPPSPAPVVAAEPPAVTPPAPVPRPTAPPGLVRAAGAAEVGLGAIGVIANLRLVKDIAMVAGGLNDIIEHPENVEDGWTWTHPVTGDVYRKEGGKIMRYQGGGA